MAHKLKKFCKITRYIEQIDGELSQMISDLCLERLFIPRGVNGITFLYPKDDSYRKELISSAYSNNPEKAIQMLESLIILDHLPRPGDFVLKKDDIPNSLHQRIEVTSADASSVKLTCGATLHPDPGFAPISTRENMAVYHIKGAQIPLNGPKATMKYASKRRNKGEKAGGYMGGARYGGVDGRVLYKEVKDATFAQFSENKNSNRALEVVTSFLKFLLVDKSRHAHLRELVDAGRLSPCPLACFFTMLDPVGRGLDDIHLNQFLLDYKPTSYIPVSNSSDLLVEFQTIVKQCYAVSPTTTRNESQRLALQKALIKIQVPTAQIEPALKAYKTYYGDETDVVSKYLRYHETTFITMRFIYDAAEEKGEQAAHNIDEAFNQYERTMNTESGSLLNMSLLKGRYDPANLHSGARLFILSSMFLGGPTTGNFSSENLGSTDPNLFDNPAGLESNLNLHDIMYKMYETGSPAALTMGGMKALMSSFE